MEIANNLPRERHRNTTLALAVPLVLCMALAAYAYQKAFTWWYYEWTYNGSYYSHAVFIPFFVAAMIWRDKEKLRRLPITRSWWGLIPMALAALFFLYGYRGDVTATLSVSFMLFLLGAMMIATGKAMTRALLFPLVFLMSVIPVIPNQVIGQLAFPIQLTSAKLSATILNLIGFPAQRFGTQIQMENYALNVEQPCSGFKTLVGLLAFAGAFAYLVEGPLWKRWALFLFTAPFSIVINGLRIALIGLVGELFSAQAALTFHDYSGFLVLILGFMVLFSLAKVIKCERLLGLPLQDPPPGMTAAEERAANEARKAAEIEALEKRYGPPRSDSLARLAVGLYPVLALLALGGAARAIVKPPVSNVPVMQAEKLPTVLEGGAWHRLGADTPITPDVKATLEPETYLDRNYVAQPPRSGAINLFITGGSSRRTFHDPHDCFIGSGYKFTDIGVQTIDTAAGPVSVQESVVEHPGEGKPSLLMFLYVVDGEMIHSMAKVHGRILQKTFFGGSGRPFYFVRFRQLAAGTEEERRQEMRDFIRAIWPSIAPQVMDQPAAKTARR